MLIRRSNLLVPVGNADAVNDAWRHDAQVWRFEAEVFAEP